VVNSGVRSLRGIHREREYYKTMESITLIYKLKNYNILVEYLYQFQNRSSSTSVLVYIIVTPGSLFRQNTWYLSRELHYNSAWEAKVTFQL